MTGVNLVLIPWSKMFHLLNEIAPAGVPPIGADAKVAMIYEQGVQYVAIVHNVNPPVAAVVEETLAASEGLCLDSEEDRAILRDRLVRALGGTP